MHLTITPDDAALAAACLGNFLDNEHDKGRDGIGEELMSECDVIVLRLEDIIQHAPATGATLHLSLMEAALLHRALVIHSDEGHTEEVFEIPNGTDIAHALIHRIVNGGDHE